MQRLIRFYLFPFCFVFCNHLRAGEIIAVQDSSLANYFFNQSFETNHSDSILFFLNLAIKNAKEENNDDIYVEALVEKAIEFERNKKGDSSSFYFYKTINAARESQPSYAILAKVYKQYGNFLSHQNQYFPALNYLDTAANLYLTASDTLSYADILAMKGAVQDNGGNEGKALRLYLEASKIYERHERTAVLADIMNNVAIVYKKIGDLDGSLEYYNKSLQLQEAMNDTAGVAISKVNRGLLFKDLNRLDEALEDIRTSLPVFAERKMNYAAAIAHHNLAEVHLQLNNLDSVLYHVDQSEQIAVDLQYWQTIVGNNIILTKALRGMGRPALSAKTALRGYSMAKEHGLLERQEELAGLLAENYEIVKDYALALKYYKEHKLIKDSLLSTESQEQINKLRTEYDFQQKEEDIRDLELINSYQTTLVEKEEKLKHVLVAGIVLLMFALVLFFYLYRRQRNFSKTLSKQKAQLTGLNKEKDDLIAMVAHDLRSPLNNIKGLLGIIKDANGTEHGKMIELANQSTDVLRNRINKILDVEAINVGRINLKITEVNVSEVLKQLTHHVSPEAEKKQISFFSSSLKNLTCRADENYLLQVLENLCTNAIKFSEQQSEIYIKVAKKGSKITFEVQDQGQGIPEDEIENLFTRYAKISTLPTENEMSTGLGLPIVKKYVEAMGGEVWCRSKVGEGSTFFVTLESGDLSTSDQ